VVLGKIEIIAGAREEGFKTRPSNLNLIQYLKKRHPRHLNTKVKILN
jgi:hypothetical protein